MANKTRTIFEIFLQGIGLYFTNIDRFVWYMFLPVAGQIIGAGLIIFILYAYREYNALILSNIPALKSPLYMKISIGIILLIPIIIWLKSFWDYITAYGAVNSMTENMLKSERVYDFNAHRLLVTHRRLPFIGLWVMYGALILLTSIPIFLVFGLVLLVYYAFIFQVFTFEPELSPYDCFKKSSTYVSGHFKRTLYMIMLIGGLTYIIIPQIVLAFAQTVKAVDYLKGILTNCISIPALDPLNMVISAMGFAQITPEGAALFFVKLWIVIAVIQIMLPLRVICMCLWYKNFYNDSGYMKKLDDKVLKRAGR